MVSHAHANVSKHKVSVSIGSLVSQWAKKQMAEQVIAEMRKNCPAQKQIYSSVEAAGKFYKAEEYFQNYVSKGGGNIFCGR